MSGLTYASFALPGIVIALAYVYFGINFVQPLYQSMPMLLAAYVVLFIPQAVGAERTSLMQVSPSLEEAARSLGTDAGHGTPAHHPAAGKAGHRSRGDACLSDHYERTARHP